MHQNRTRSEVVQSILNTFFNEERQLFFKKGDYLFKTGDRNEKLYYIQKGAIKGVLEEEYHDDFVIFNKKIGDFVGLYSFFDDGDICYTTVTAEADAELLWISKAELIQNGKYEQLCHQMATILSQDLLKRSYEAKMFSEQKQAATKSAVLNDSLNTLGQMSSALAHELNNAVGVIHQKSTWFQGKFIEIINEKYDRKLISYFEKGLEQGQSLDTGKMRSVTKEILQIFPKITNQIAKRITKIGLSVDDLPKPLPSDFEASIHQKYLFWTCGVTLRNIENASLHASHVVKSVKMMSVVNTDKFESVKVKENVKKAIDLLPSETLKTVHFDLALDDMPNVMASEGDLIQVWLNLIKNGCEAMLNANVEHPCIRVTGRHTRKNVHIKIFNTGPEIPKEIQKIMFQPNVTTKKTGLSFGLGLGLSIVKEIVKRMDGEINFESNSKETMFRIKLTHIDYNSK